MTTQITPTSTTAPPSAKESRKATKDTDDQVADQFAAMFASLCLAPAPQPTPAAKAPEAAPADSLANLEIAGTDGIPALPTPVVMLQTLAVGTGAGTGVPELATGESLAPANMEPKAPLWLSQIPVPSSQRQAAGSPSPSTSLSAQPAETTSPSPMVLPPVIKSANAGLVDPAQSAGEVAPTEFRSRSAADAAVAQDPLVVASNILAEQTLQTEAARRDANLVAAYLAKTARNDREGNAAAGVKTMLAGNGFDMSGQDRERDSNLNSRLQFSALTGEGSFAATVRDLQSNGGAPSGSASSIQAQTISQIIAQAENLPGRQTRSLRLRLRPEELGQIDIQLSRDAAGRISAQISAESESARGVLSRSLDELRETLARAGLTVDKLQISPEAGLSEGNRGNDDARSNSRESSPAVASLLTRDEMKAGGLQHAENEKLLSLRA